MHIAIINGPNLDLLGTRQPHIYGGRSFEDYLKELKERFSEHNFSYFQSNVEGELVTALHELALENDAIILNAAAYTHTSVAIGDAVAALHLPVVEVHISKVQARETYRHHSYIAKNAEGVIAGFGLDSYRLAVEALAAKDFA